MELTRGSIAAVVIGRNEGVRLGESLASVRAAGLRSTYVDSGSSDGSADLARASGASTIELDPARPFSAARGRNEGFDEVGRRWPEVKYVIFLDGDCVLDSGFPAAAVAMFEKRADCAVVTGHLTEQHPDASIYNQLCAIEWRSPAGQIENARLGGIMAVRVSAFRDVGGFEEKVVAGEEPDLAVRLGRAGYTIFKIDVAMASHDADMHSFGQWWKRSMRGGHGLAQLFERHRRAESPIGARELKSAFFWGFGLPVLSLVLLWPTRGLSLVLLGAYAVLGSRIFKHYADAGLARNDAWLVTRFLIASKFAEVAGIFRFWFNRLRGRIHGAKYS